MENTKPRPQERSSINWEWVRRHMWRKKRTAAREQAAQERAFDDAPVHYRRYQ